MLPPETKLISVDDHIVEPPHTWTSRLPSRYQEAGPHVVELDNGRQAWSYEGRRIPIEVGMVRTRPEVDAADLPGGHVRFDEMRPGCYDPVERLDDMAVDGVWAQVAFPTFARFSGHRFVEGDDKELSRLCTQAYNDFLFEEWYPGGDGRLLPMVALPIWDLAASVAEVERTAALGARAVAFSENPHKLGLPSLHTDHWEPLWAAIADTGLPVCIHIGSSGSLITSSPDAPWAVTLSLNGLNSMVTCVDWLSSGIFERHPALRLVLSEGGAGWVPYILERAEKEFEIQGARAGTLRNPRELFAEHVYACMVTDYVAIKNLDDIGVDRVMWESDYPHNDGMWPHSRSTLEKALSDVPDDDARKIGELNARRVFGIAD